MKVKNLKRIETLTAALLLLGLALGCGQAKQPEPEVTADAPAAVAPSAKTETATTPAAAPLAATPAPAASTTATAASATGIVHYDASATGSKVKMDGTANIKDWSMETAIVGGFLEADAGFPKTSGGKVTAQVFMPVRSFKSGSGAMDARMQKEMKEPQFKKIEYTLLELKPKSAAPATGPVQFDAVGTLAVVGKPLTNSMPVTIERLADGKLKVTGSTNLKMTDYGIEPPSTLGLFVSGDELKISFEWLLAPKAQ